MSFLKKKKKHWSYKLAFHLSSFRPISLVLEPILKEPGDISFTWLEIHRTKNALLQQLDLHVNASVTTGMGSQTSSQSAAGSNTGIGGLGTSGSGSAANAGGSAGGATANETLNEFGFFPKESDCEYKCPEIDACIAASLWCDGEYRLPVEATDHFSGICRMMGFWDGTTTCKAVHRRRREQETFERSSIRVNGQLLKKRASE